MSESLKIASAADESIPESIPQVSKIIGMRNRIAHSYDVLDDEIIWQATIRQIPALIAGLEALLDG